MEQTTDLLIPALSPMNIFPHQEESAGPTHDFFIFELDSELYAVSVADVDQVMKVPPVTTVPNSPEAIVGIFHLRAKVVVVLDLLKRMRLTRLRSFVPNYLFVVHHGKEYFAILADHTRTVVRVPIKDIFPPDPMITARIPARYVSGMFMYADEAADTARKHVPDIMIRAKMDEEQLSEGPLPRPVLWFNIATLLDEQDLLQVTSTLA